MTSTLWKSLAAGGVLLVALTYWLVPGWRRAAQPPAPEPPPPPSHFQIELLNQIQVETLRNQLVAADMSKDPKRLSRHEATVYSQAGEDGAIAEIFRRIGVTNRHFVEFGSGDGSENNTVLLLEGGWSGLWMDGVEQFTKGAAEKFQAQVGSGQLRVRHAFVNAENIVELLDTAKTPAAFDLLVVDIDRNDYWVWKAIRSYSPRVVVIEYNAIFPPGISWVVNYEAKSWWDGSSHFGASLTALEKLGKEKGYSLVGCNLLGSNAYFVRDDLAGNRFASPYTAENHYQPPRYFMVWYKGGHPRKVGPPGQLEFPGHAR